MANADKRGLWRFWIDRGGTFTDVVGLRPGRAPARAQAAVGKSRRLFRRRGGGRARAVKHTRRRADSARPHRQRQDGHDRRHQRAAGAQGRAHAAGDDARLRRRAGDRQSGAAATFSRATSSSRSSSTPASSRSTSASAPTAQIERAPDLAAAREALRTRARAGLRGRRHRLHARVALSAAREA